MSKAEESGGVTNTEGGFFEGDKNIVVLIVAMLHGLLNIEKKPLVCKQSCIPDVQHSCPNGVHVKCALPSSQQ